MQIDYDIINNNTLISILKSIKLEMIELGYNDFFKIWSNFINKFANDLLRFKNNNISSNSFNECFSLEYSFGSHNILFQFDIYRILQNVENHTLQFTPSTSSYLKDDFYFTSKALFNMKLKTTPPVLVYLPRNEKNQYTHYCVIDGNHRVSNFIKDNKPFDIYLISPVHLKMEYFLNLNSWIAYHLISGYYFAHELPEKEFHKYIKSIQYILTDAAITLMPLHQNQPHF